MMKLDIEWDSPDDIRRDGTRRPYHHKYSTVHGWVTKMRGTLLDNEHMRREGIREMKAAKAVREWERKHADELRGQKKGGNIISFLNLGSSKHRSASRAVVVRSASRKSSIKKSESSAALHFSHRSKPPSRSQSTRVDGRITQSKATVSREHSMASRERPTVQRRHTTDVARRPSRHHSSSHHSKQDGRPRTTTRRSTRS